MIAKMPRKVLRILGIPGGVKAEGFPHFVKEAGDKGKQSVEKRKRAEGERNNKLPEPVGFCDIIGYRSEAVRRGRNLKTREKTRRGWDST